MRNSSYEILLIWYLPPLFPVKEFLKRQTARPVDPQLEDHTCPFRTWPEDPLQMQLKRSP
jgi:hypothetical protein